MLTIFKKEITASRQRRKNIRGSPFKNVNNKYDFITEQIQLKL